MIDDPLDSALGLDPLPYELPVISIPEKGKEADFARENMARMIGKMEHYIDQLADVARQSQHPLAYDKLNMFAKNYIDANHELHRMLKTVRENSGEDAGPKTINNTLVMTSDEVLRALKKDRSVDLSSMESDKPETVIEARHP